MCKFCEYIQKNNIFRIENYISNDDILEIEEYITIYPSSSNIMIKIQNCNNLERLPIIKDNKNRKLGILLIKLNNFKELDGYKVDGIKDICISNCEKIENIKNISNYGKLYLDNCSNLKKIEQISNIEILDIHNCGKIDCMENIMNIYTIRLDNVKISKIIKIFNIEAIKINTNIQFGDLSIYNVVLAFNNIEDDISKIVKIFNIYDKVSSPLILMIDDTNYEMINEMSKDVELLL